MAGCVPVVACSGVVGPLRVSAPPAASAGLPTALRGLDSPVSGDLVSRPSFVRGAAVSPSCEVWGGTGYGLRVCADSACEGCGCVVCLDPVV